MAVTIYHNPACGTSRTVLAAIRDKGIEPEIIEYLKTPPDSATLKSLLTRMGMTPRELLRKRGTPFEDLKLDNPALTDDELIDAMVTHPILIERPVVVTPKGVKLCRPADLVETIL